MEEKFLSYFVPQWDPYKKEAVMWDIFNNYSVHDWCVRDIKRYLRAPSKFKSPSLNKDVPDVYGFEGLCREFERSFANQFWARYEYEYSIGEAFPLGDDGKPRGELYKKDAYWILKPNIPFIVNGCISQYKEWLKAKNTTAKENSVEDL